MNKTAQHLVTAMSPETHAKLGLTPKPIKPRNLKIAEGLHKLHGLDSAVDETKPVNLRLPSGLDLNGLLAAVQRECDPYIERLNRLLYGYSPKLERLRVPSIMPFGPGWWAWDGRKWIESSEPAGITAVLDFETTWTDPDRLHWFPVCCVVIDCEGVIRVWQVDPELEELDALVDLGPECLIVGHNISYDRSFLKSEYLLAGTSTRFWDTMSAFIATRGITNQQQAALKKAEKYNIYVGEWTDETTTNGLDAVHEFYGLGALDKGVRQQLVDRGWQWVRRNLDKVLHYCIKDVLGTLRVFQHVYPEWLLAQPSAVSRLSQIELGSVWVPLSPERWPNYAKNADACVEVIEAEASAFLEERVEAVKDEYLDRCKELAKSLNPHRKKVLEDSKHYWPGAIKDLTKHEKKDRDQWVDAEFTDRTSEIMDRFLADMPANLACLDWMPALSGKTSGLPKWYRDIKDDYGVRKRWAPCVMGMTWNGRPIYWSSEAVKPYKNDKGNPGDRGGFVTADGPIPHPEKRGKRVTSVFAKGFVEAGEKSILDAPDANASAMLKKYVSTTLWASMQSRIHSLKVHDFEGFPVCIPRLAVTGTISRRCADSVWQVLSNPKAKRIGSELKSMIQAVPGYVFVGADVEAQEAWIASMLGDMLTGGYCGITGFAYSIYIGSKSKGTDFHSLNAARTGLSRSDAKIPGFATLYGGGVAGVTDYLLALNPNLTYEEARVIAQAFISAFKGDYDNYRSLAGGLASEAFNAMSMIANAPNPETPVLKARLTRALAGIKDFATTRNNWVVQSSGADFRDCLVCFGNYFFRDLGVDGRLILTIHDEIRYMVREEHARKAAYALQLAHIYTRALFIREMGMDCLPASVAWFPAVDVDHILRKEPDEPCVTPSQPEAIKPGYCLKPGDLTEFMESVKEPALVAA